MSTTTPTAPKKPLTRNKFRTSTIALGVVAGALLIAVVVLVVLYVLKSPTQLQIEPSTAVVAPNQGFTEFYTNNGKPATWSVSDPTVAKISEMSVGARLGDNSIVAKAVMVEGLKTGFTTIVAKDEQDNVVAQSTLIVELLTIDPIVVDIAVGQSFVVTSSVDTTQWSCVPSSVATITPGPSKTATVTGVSGGTFTITAQAGAQSAGANGYVLAVTPSSVTVEENTPVTFTSSQDAVVWTVEGDGLKLLSTTAYTATVSGSVAGVGKVTVSYKSSSASAAITVTSAPPPKPSEIAVTPTSATAPINAQLTFTSSVQATWSVEGTGLSIVSSTPTSATVTGSSAGSGSITAKSVSNPQNTASASINITGTAGITVSPSSASVVLGASSTFTASADVTWTVSGNGSDISIVSSTPTTVVVKGNAVGTGTILATSASGQTANATLNVVAFSVFPQSTSVVKGATVTLTSPTSTTSWAVNNASVATIAPSQGQTTTVTGVSPGSATVTATDVSGATATSAVTVTPASNQTGRTVVYINGPNWAYGTHDPTQPTPFTTVIIAFVYTNYQASNSGSGYTPPNNSKFEFTLNAFACNGLFLKADSPMALWLTNWRAADPKREIFISFGGAAYEWGGFYVYDAWAANPSAVVSGIVSLLETFKFFPIDGVDFDYECTESLMSSCVGTTPNSCACASYVGVTCPNNPEPWGATMLIAICKGLHEALPALKISHAPQGPYLVPNCNSVYVNNQGGYEFIIKQLGSIVTFYFVQFYNNSGFMACGPSAASGYTIGNVIQYMLGMGCTPDQVIVGKPLKLGDSGGCWTPPQFLQWCISTPADKYGGVGFWVLTGDDPEGRWTLMEQFQSPSINSQAPAGDSCPQYVCGTSATDACKNNINKQTSLCDGTDASCCGPTGKMMMGTGPTGCTGVTGTFCFVCDNP